MRLSTLKKVAGSKQNVQPTVCSKKISSILHFKNDSRVMNYSSSISKDELLCRVHSMVKAYRNYGHLEADIDPLGLNVPKKYVTITFLMN